MLDIFLCDLFLIMANIDVASYADNNTPYTARNLTEKVIQKVIQKLENFAKISVV